MPKLPVQSCSPGRTRTSDREANRALTAPSRGHYPLLVSNLLEAYHDGRASVTIAAVVEHTALGTWLLRTDQVVTSLAVC
jgi:hypothetical protein